MYYRDHFQTAPPAPFGSLLLVQCDSGDHKAKLIACAQHYVRNKHIAAHGTQLSAHGPQQEAWPHHVILIVQLQRNSIATSYVGFQVSYLDYTHQSLSNIHLEPQGWLL